MEIEGRPLWDRTGEAAIVLAVFLVSDYITGDYGWGILLGVPIVYFVIRLAIDTIRNRATQ